MTSLSLGQALRNAIEAEDAARRFYKLLAESTSDERARTFLEKMAGDEKAHHEQITEYAREAADLQIPNLPDANVELIETMPEWADADDIDYDHALAVALEAELHAALYYDAIADALDEGKPRDLFQMIARTEEQHAQNLRELMGE